MPDPCHEVGTREPISYRLVGNSGSRKSLQYNNFRGVGRVGLEPTYENAAGSARVLDSSKVAGGTHAYGGSRDSKFPNSGLWIADPVPQQHLLTYNIVWLVGEQP